MRGPKPPTLELSAAARQDLAQLVRRHATPQQLALRARIVRAAAAGANTGQLARDRDVARAMVRRWRERWLALQAAARDDLPLTDRLTDAPRPGTPTRMTDAQVCQIVALACALPAGADRPISHWTGRELAAAIVNRGIVPQLSGRHAARLLTRGIAHRTGSARG